jgi:hypothetical protein
VGTYGEHATADGDTWVWCQLPLGRRARRLPSAPPSPSNGLWYLAGVKSDASGKVVVKRGHRTRLPWAAVAGGTWERRGGSCGPGVWRGQRDDVEGEQCNKEWVKTDRSEKQRQKL